MLSVRYLAWSGGGAGRRQSAGRGRSRAARFRSYRLTRRQVPAVVSGVRCGPPDLVVGGGDDLAQFGAGDGAADGKVDVRGEPPLGFDGGEVLQVVAGEPAQVLDEPVEQRGEVQRIPCGLGVIVGVRVGRCSVLADPAIRRTRQRNEQRRPEGLAVRRCVSLPDCPEVDLAAGERCGVLAPLGGEVAARPGREARGRGIRHR
jgi:hypothetical protein